jgi:2,4-dienoyl-CoA reductase-like NADH-dependent reductase (Old Yellow Enzyme family)
MKYLTFTPFETENLAMRNRIVKSATAEAMATEDGFVTQDLIEFYKRLAEGGSGTIITGFMYVNEKGRAMHKMTGISRDEHVEGLKKLVEEVKEAGRLDGTDESVEDTGMDTDIDVKIVVQLAHAGRQNYPFDDPVAPSAILEPVTNVMPRELTREEIYAIIDDFVNASLRADRAGFDAVQLHAAHGYLLSQFLSPHTNRRRDEFGKERAKILLDIFDGIRKKSKIPVMVKMNGSDFIPGGLEIEEAIRISKLLDDAGFEAIEVSGGMWESSIHMRYNVVCQNVKKSGEAYFAEFARRIKENVSIPVITVGGIRSLEVSERLLKEHADLISMARPLIKDPYLPLKWMREEQLASECKSCNKCLKSISSKKLDCYG